jgi:lipopolysaccharide biosynthesis glycosyltransferase
MLPICFIVDKNVFMYLDVVIKSIKHTLSIPFHVCVLTESDDTSLFTTILLKTFLVDSQFTVKSLSDKDTERLNSLYVEEARKDITGFGYAQLLVCEYFSEHEKILFMEPDQIVRSDLADFWKEMCDKDIKLAAVNYNNGGKTLRTLTELYHRGQVKHVRAFNCGVVVYDTQFWISNNLRDVCFGIVEKQKETGGAIYDYYAEGAMNIALQNCFYELDKKYNLCDLGWNQNIPKSYIDSAIILHWNGMHKPWKPDGFYKEYYTAK